MSEERSLVPVGGSADAFKEAVPVAEPAPARSPFEIIRGLLRGRGWFAVVLGLLLGGLGAFLGFKVPTPEYTSVGLIEIKPNAPSLLYNRERGNPSSWFSMFVKTQRERLMGRRVLTRAMEAESWDKVGGVGTDDPAEFADRLHVAIRSSGNIVSIGYTDPDPVAAGIGAQAVIDAYLFYHGDEDEQDKSKKMAKLEQLRQTWEGDLATLKGRIKGLAEELGPEVHEDRYLFKISLMNNLDQALSAARIEFHTMEAMSGALPKDEKEEEPAEAPEKRVITVEEIGYRDSRMNALLSAKRVLEAQIEDLREDLGPKHKSLIDANNRLEILDDTIEETARIWREMNGARPETKSTILEDLRDKVARLESMHKTARGEVEELVKDYQQLQGWTEEQKLIEGRIAEVKQKIHEMRVEAEMSGRISRMGSAFVPKKPSSDKRVQMSVVGICGAGFGLGLVLLMGLLDRRFRNSSDLTERIRSVDLLGLLPKIPRDLSDRERTETVAHCVHQIRAVLQLRSAGSSTGRVFCITSPASGTGKTTLSLALGLSFSASRANTLLIDMDLVGKGLTSRFNRMLYNKLERDLDQPAPTDGPSDAENLAARRRALLEMLLLGASSGEKEWQDRDRLWALLERAVDQMGIHRVREEGLLSSIFLMACDAQSNGWNEQWRSLVNELGLTEGVGDGSGVPPPMTMKGGLMAALSGVDLDDCVQDTGLPNLSLLPHGLGREGSGTELSPSAIDQMIRAARSRFDTILVDTGPLPGSLEASMVAACADGVILTVSRGEQRPLAEATMSHLCSIGAKPFGLVFNRADATDVTRSSHSHVSQMSARHQP